MSTHLLAVIVTVILTEWLLLAGWMKADGQYYFWAATVILLWWLGNLRSNPPWPKPSDYHIRLMIFGGFFGITLLFALMISTFSAFLVALLILVLPVAEVVLKNRIRGK